MEAVVNKLILTLELQLPPLVLGTFMSPNTRAGKRTLLDLVDVFNTTQPHQASSNRKFTQICNKVCRYYIHTSWSPPVLVTSPPILRRPPVCQPLIYKTKTMVWILLKKYRSTFLIVILQLQKSAFDEGPGIATNATSLGQQLYNTSLLALVFPITLLKKPQLAPNVKPITLL